MYWAYYPRLTEHINPDLLILGILTLTYWAYYPWLTEHITPDLLNILPLTYWYWAYYPWLTEHITPDLLSILPLPYWAYYPWLTEHIIPDLLSILPLTYWARFCGKPMSRIRPSWIFMKSIPSKSDPRSTAKNCSRTSPTLPILHYNNKGWWSFWWSIMAVGEVAVREPTCTDNGAPEVGCHSSSSPPSPSPALERVSYPFTRWVNHHSQPSLFHCWTKVSLLLDHKSLSSAIPGEFLPLCFTKSVVQLVFGLPLFLLPMGFHFMMSNARLSLALAAWPAQFHFDVFSICRMSGKFVCLFYCGVVNFIFPCCS